MFMKSSWLGSDEGRRQRVPKANGTQEGSLHILQEKRSPLLTFNHHVRLVRAGIMRVLEEEREKGLQIQIHMKQHTHTALPPTRLLPIEETSSQTLIKMQTAKQLKWNSLINHNTSNDVTYLSFDSLPIFIIFKITKWPTTNTPKYTTLNEHHHPEIAWSKWAGKHFEKHTTKQTNPSQVRNLQFRQKHI